MVLRPFGILGVEPGLLRARKVHYLLFDIFGPVLPTFCCCFWIIPDDAQSNHLVITPGSALRITPDGDWWTIQDAMD